MISFVVGLGAIAAVILLVHPAPPLLASGTHAPRIALTSDAGAHLDVFASADGNPVLLQFFATTCANCQAQLPQLCGLHSAFPGVTVVGVDASRESRGQVVAYAGRYRAPGCDVPLLVDPGAKVSTRYSITVVPTVYVVDGAGTITAAGFGKDAVDAARGELRRLAGG